MAKAASAYWKRRQSTAPRLASPEKRSHGGVNPKPGSGWTDPRNSTLTAEAHYCTKQTTRPTSTAAGTSPPPTAPTRATAGWAGSLCLSLSYCSARGAQCGSAIAESAFVCVSACAQHRNLFFSRLHTRTITCRCICFRGCNT
jgi:hypothetical protein